jgi:hypothetical protein
MSDLNEKKWAVISERGCESLDLTYEDARRLVHRLLGEGRRGLCIVASGTARGLVGGAVPADAPVPNRNR